MDRPSQRPNIPLENIKWIRARDLYKNPKLVVNGGKRSDVNQGNTLYLFCCRLIQSLQVNLETAGFLQPCQVMVLPKTPAWKSLFRDVRDRGFLCVCPHLSGRVRRGWVYRTLLLQALQIWQDGDCGKIGQYAILCLVIVMSSLQVVDDLIPCVEGVPLFTKSHDEGEVHMTMKSLAYHCQS